MKEFYQLPKEQALFKNPRKAGRKCKKMFLRPGLYKDARKGIREDRGCLYRSGYLI